MRNWLIILVISTACVVLGLSGCGFSVFDIDPTALSDFLGLPISKFTGDSALVIRSDAGTTESTEASFPEDLLQDPPEGAVMVLSVPYLAVTVDNQASADATPTELHATVTFRLAPRGEDACASDNVVGPFEIIVIDGQVELTTESVPLDKKTQAAVRSGRTEICAETSADFDGTLSIGKVVIEFGELIAGEGKTELCHVPSDNPSNQHTIIVGSSAVDAHLAHGDYLGACVEQPDPAPVEDLMLASTCAEDPGMADWIVSNPNSFDVAVTWEVSGTTQTGSIVATPGNTSFQTSAEQGSHTTIIHSLDENNNERTAEDTYDAAACSYDTDGDGVEDSVDECADTPAGEAADASGCSCSQTDGDDDGVDDCDDLCADTPAGETVGTTGCSCSQADSDNDGVDDCDDLCADTPADEAADASGCSCSQTDGDDDGVDDCDDLCPDTQVDAVVDGFGCETIVVDAGENMTLNEIGPVTLQATVTGGTEPYSYVWTASGWDGSAQQDPTVVPSETTTYTVTVTDWSFPPKTGTDTVTLTIDPHDGLQYTITEIGSLSSKASYPAGINEAGQVVGYYYNDSMKKRAFLYDNGTLTDLGDIGGGEAYARDINNSGQVVGEAKTSGGPWTAFVWDATGGMQDLGTLGGTSSIAYAINDAGEIVGYSTTAIGEYHAFLYTGGAMTNLTIGEYAQGGAFDINSTGQIAGLLLSMEGNATGFVYDGGTITDIGSPMLSGSQAWSINDDGLVAGYSWGADGYRSWVYSNGSVVGLGDLEGFPETYVWGMSETGQIVGHLRNEAGTLSHAFVYTGGKLNDLNDFLVAGHGWDYLTAAYAVNSDGKIAGYGRIDGQYRSFILTPVP